MKLFFLFILALYTSIASQGINESSKDITNIYFPTTNEIISICAGKKTYGSITHHDFFILDKSTNKTVMNVSDSTNIFYSLQISSQREYLLLVSNPLETVDARIYTEEGQLVSQISGVETNSVEFSPNGDYIYMFRQSALEDHHFKLYQASTGEQIELPFSVDYPRFIAEFIDTDKLVIVFHRQKVIGNNSVEKRTSKNLQGQRGLPNRMATSSTHEILSSLLIIYNLSDNTYIEKELTTREGNAFIMNWDCYKKIIPLNDKFVILGKDKSRNLPSLSSSDCALIFNTNGTLINGISLNLTGCEYCGVESFLAIDDNRIILHYNDSKVTKLLEWDTTNNEFEEIYTYESRNSLVIENGFIDTLKNELYLYFWGEHDPVVIDRKEKTIVAQIGGGIAVQGAQREFYQKGASQIMKINLMGTAKEN